MSVNSEFSYEEVISKHKKEQKELQGRILQLKKSISSNCKDKKKKKEILSEIDALKEDLKTKQNEELAKYQEHHEVGAEKLCEDINSLTVSENDSSVVENEYSYSVDEGRKMSKAQRRRKQKAESSKQRESEIEESERMAVHGARNIEIEKIRKILGERNLKEFQIAADGNCMFAAVAHQLKEEKSISFLRRSAADHMKSNMNDFISFMVCPSTGEMLTPTQFEQHCLSLQDSATWGGQPELRALSHVLQQRIEVIQADCPPITIGDEYSLNGTVVLGYYRHYFGLGEHYNSVVPLKTSCSDEK